MGDILRGRLALMAAAGLGGALLSGCSGSEQVIASSPPPPPQARSMPLPPAPYAPPPAPAPLKRWVAQPDWSALAWDNSHAGAPLHIGDYGPLIFADEFDTCSIGKEEFKSVGHFNWFAHHETNPGKGGTYITFDFQDAPDGPPFTCPGDGYLHALARYDQGDKTWHTGGIFGQDSSHEGFSAPYGYMEFRVRLNSASLPLRPWAALWAWSRESMNGAAQYNAHQYTEIDILETNLRSPTDSNLNASTIHYWPSAAPAPGQALTQHVAKVSPPQTFPTFDDQWHTFGLAMTPQYFIVYRDRVELTRLPRLAEDVRQPMTPIIDVSSYFGPQGADPNKVYDVMDVDYVHVYAPSH